jgi:transcription-repair coupling factor (superfamily II helicase)
LLTESVADMRGEEMPLEKDLRIELPVKAFIPPGWVAQEALRLDLYRRISTAGDHAQLEAVLSETVDRYGALPEEVSTLFAVASLRVTCGALGVDEVSTFRDQVRLRPVIIDESLLADLDERVSGAVFHPETRTLNLAPERVPGVDLPGWVEARLRAATGRTEDLPVHSPS